MPRLPTPRSTDRARSTDTALVPVPKIDVVDPSVRGGVTLGRLLETARRRIDMSQAAAAHRLRIAEHELLDFESGMRTPAPSLLDDMCEVYGTTKDRLVSDAGIALDDAEEPSQVWLGWASVDLSGIGNRERLFRIAATFRELRSLAADAPVTIRDEEVAFLARTVDVVDEHLLDDLADAFVIDRQSALEIFARMRYSVSRVKELDPAPTPIALGPEGRATKT
jgi:transcriptional regulator with XRE-family HTH domain